MKRTIQIILIIVFLIVTFKVFNEISNFDPNMKRLACQNKTVTFEKIFFDNPIWEANDLIETNNVIITSNIEYSKYMDSHLKNIMTIEQADRLLLNVLKDYRSTETKEVDKKLVIDYYIYENDKKDTGKKGKKSKLYAGYIMFEFKLDDQLLYKIQTDYMDIDGKDIKERMDCAIRSFLTLK
jgi:hypothetical protein